MASGRGDLADRLDDVEAAVDTLLDEHAVARARVRDLEAVVMGEEPAGRRRPTGEPAERGQSMDELRAVDRIRPAPEDEATQAEVERAVQEVELEEEEEEEEERDGEFIVA